MQFWQLVEDIISSLRLTDKEFYAATGLKAANISWWRDNPSTVPQMGTIRRIEDGLNIQIILDSNGVPKSWEKSSPESIKAPQATSENSANLPNNAGVEVGGNNYFPLRERREFPASAREMVESIKFYGGTIDWGSLTQEQQEKIKWKYEQTKLAVDKAYREYERIVEEKESEFSMYLVRIKLGEDLAAGDEPF